MSLDADFMMLAWTLVAAAAAAIFDLRTGLIPNRLVFATLTVGFALSLGIAVAHGLEHVPAAGLSAVLGALVCGIIPLALYAFNGLGGGDLKLLVAVGACLGPALGFSAQVYAFACASLYAFGRAAFEGTLFRTLVDSATVLTHPLIPRSLRKPVSPSTLRELRFAPAIFVGVLVAALNRGLSP